MLIKKLTLTTAMILVALAFAAGGASLNYRAHAGETANQRQDAAKDDQSKPAEAPKADQPKSTEAETAKDEQAKPIDPPKENQPKSTDAPTPKDEQPGPADRPTEENPRAQDNDKDPPQGGEANASPLSEEGWQSRQRKVECGVYTFTTLRTGKAALAYNAPTREVKAVRLHSMKDESLWVTPVVVGSTNKELVALGVKGSKITRVALFNLKSGKWTPLDLDEPVNGAVWPMSFGPDTVAYEVGDFLYLYNPEEGRMGSSGPPNDHRRQAGTRCNQSSAVSG